MTRAAELVSSDLAQIAAGIQEADRFLLTTHENPDGDALGSLLAMHHILGSMGKDSVMFLAAKEFPLPVEYRFLALEEVFHEPPADMSNRVVIFLDCGNIDRMPVDFLKGEGVRTLNIDHHHDNTRFGDLNLVDQEASSTAEVLFELAGALGVALNPAIALALYVGVVTDTGRFMYENTDARTHRTAAALIEAGVNVPDVYRRLYERMPLIKLKLIARALAAVDTYEDGALAITYVSDADYAESGGNEALTEGIIDYLRSIEGVSLAAVIRDQSDGRARKASLRSANGGVDVSEIARKQGGGGHRRAAGFSTDMTFAEVVEFLRAEVAALRAHGDSESTI